MTLRICIAAQEAGVDLTGTTFLVGSEPITPAKAKAITNTGAAFFPTYAMFELGQVAAGCTNPRCSDDMHVAKDFVALIDHPLTLAGGETVDALNFTTLLPTAPLIMLNAEIDDYGKVEDCACGCPMEALGYTQHVSQVASYTKLVSEGVSIIGSDVVRILEEVLPEKFGGSPLDYQLMEEEDQQGLTRVHLVVSPRVRLVDEAQIRSVFWNALKSVQDSYIWAQNLWSQGRILKVVRMEPHVTTRGKHLTLWRKKSQPNKG